MDKYSKNRIECKCSNCGLDFSKEKRSIRKGTKNFFCDKTCYAEYQSKQKYKDMCEKVGCDFKVWLNQKYNAEKLNSRDLAEIAYGKRKNGPNITVWMKKLGVSVRSGSEATSMTWEKDENRKKEQAKLAVKRMGAGTMSRKKLVAVMQTEEYRTKQSIAKTGKRNGMWNPRLSEEERQLNREKGRNMDGYSVFRWKVYERDDYTCQKCGDDTGGNLVVHHIDSYKEHIDKRVDENNGITFCESCHKEYHKYYGISGANRKDFNEYLNKALVN